VAVSLSSPAIHRGDSSGGLPLPAAADAVPRLGEELPVDRQRRGQLLGDERAGLVARHPAQVLDGLAEPAVAYDPLDVGRAGVAVERVQAFLGPAARGLARDARPVIHADLREVRERLPRALGAEHLDLTGEPLQLGVGGVRPRGQGEQRQGEDGELCESLAHKAGHFFVGRGGIPHPEGIRVFLRGGGQRLGSRLVPPWRRDRQSLATEARLPGLTDQLVHTPMGAHRGLLTAVPGVARCGGALGFFWFSPFRGRDKESEHVTDDASAEWLREEAAVRRRNSGLRGKPATRAATPRHVEPMLALLVSDLPSDAARYAYEFKWDGVRAIAYWDGQTLAIESRNLLPIAQRYPELHGLGAALGKRCVVLDGEIVALDAEQRPDFGLLQRRMHVSSPAEALRLSKLVPAAYVIFDLLYLDGRSLMGEPFERRRERLEELPLSGPSWHLSPVTRGQGRRLLDAARKHRLEGVIAKRLDSLYHPGRRTGEWLKVKVVHRQEFVIGGWADGIVAGQFGSLMLGYYEQPPGKGRFGDHFRGLRFVGGVGTGFADEQRRQLLKRLKTMERSENPFDRPVKRVGGKRVHYVTPTLVAEVEFRDWTPDGSLRQASFKGLREDKRAEAVVREDRRAG
jgi:bifunctional non-homologous end joining protein LigD